MRVIPLILAVLLLQGCQLPKGSQALTDAGAATKEADNEAEATKLHLANARDVVVRASRLGLPPVPAVLESAVASIDKADKTNDAVIRNHAKALTAVANAEHDMAAKDRRYDELRQNRWVVVALWCQRVFWTVVIAIAVANVAAIALGLFSPATVAFGVGQAIAGCLRMIHPLMSWPADKMRKRKV